MSNGVWIFVNGIVPSPPDIMMFYRNNSKDLNVSIQYSHIVLLYALCSDVFISVIIVSAIIFSCVIVKSNSYFI